MISVSKWTTDTASAVRLEDCTSETFLISVQQGVALTGKLSSNNCTGTAGTLVSRGPVELRILTQPGSVAPFLLLSVSRRLQEVSVVYRFHESVACSAQEMPSLTRLVRHKSGMALAGLHVSITLGQPCGGHSCCAIISIDFRAK